MALTESDIAQVLRRSRRNRRVSNPFETVGSLSGVKSCRDRKVTNW